MGRKLNDEEYKLVRNSILQKLYSAKCWGSQSEGVWKRTLSTVEDGHLALPRFVKGHMLFERFKSGLPGHFRGNIEDALKDLINEELALFYGKTKHGDAYQLNIKKIKEIEEMLGI